jgi:hypothetical protein
MRSRTLPPSQRCKHDLVVSTRRLRARLAAIAVALLHQEVIGYEVVPS